jgi:hypothetical protein
MTQRQVTAFVKTGLVPSCTTCRVPPKHYFDQRKPARGGGHFFECCGCDSRTGRHATEDLANGEWCQRNGLPPPRPSGATRATVSHISRNR